MIWSFIYLGPAIKDLLSTSGSIRTALLLWLRNLIFSGSYRQLWYLKAAAFAVLFVSILIKRKWTIRKILVLSSLQYFLGLLGQSYYGLLKKLCPTVIFAVLRSVSNVIVTTRDGLFEGLIFITIGLLFAHYRPRIQIHKAVAGFMISMFLLLTEVYFTASMMWVREYDMYIMLVPASFFLFSISLDLPLQKRHLYKELRETGMLIFYTHTFVGWMLKRTIMKLSGIPQRNSLLIFLLTVVFSYLLACIIKHFSRKNSFEWIKALYI